jgi:hypothetical protein
MARGPIWQGIRLPRRRSGGSIKIGALATQGMTAVPTAVGVATSVGTGIGYVAEWSGEDRRTTRGGRVERPMKQQEQLNPGHLPGPLVRRQ